jgi:uncharacterized protein with von Willebrand factor type A (vWA) domain
LLLAEIASDSALEYLYEGKERLGAGPMIVLVDKSGSMRGRKDVWASAIALALVTVAAEDKRPFVVGLFQHAVNYEATVMPGEAVPASLLLRSPSGGTDIPSALIWAKEKIEHYREQKNRTSVVRSLSKADILVITDDMDTIPEGWLARFKEDAARNKIRIVGIGLPSPGYPAPSMEWADFGSRHVVGNSVLESGTISESLARDIFLPPERMEKG